jgi:hypothetical protein
LSFPFPPFFSSVATAAAAAAADAAAAAAAVGAAAGVDEEEEEEEEEEGFRVGLGGEAAREGGREGGGEAGVMVMTLGVELVGGGGASLVLLVPGLLPIVFGCCFYFCVCVCVVWGRVGWVGWVVGGREGGEVV